MVATETETSTVSYWTVATEIETSTVSDWTVCTLLDTVLLCTLPMIEPYCNCIHYVQVIYTFGRTIVIPIS